MKTARAATGGRVKFPDTPIFGVPGSRLPPETVSRRSKPIAESMTERPLPGHADRPPPKARSLWLAAAFGAASLAACGPSGAPEPNFDTPYQAVFLVNGQVFFGRLSGADSERPRLDDVFYVQTQVNPETKQTASVLIRRGKEWHGPTYMVLNARSILLIEPVGADSKVAQLIAEAQKQGAK